jgi:hypothetical protein
MANGGNQGMQTGYGYTSNVALLSLASVSGSHIEQEPIALVVIE